MDLNAQVILPREVLSALDALQGDVVGDAELAAIAEIARWQRAGEAVTVADAIAWGVKVPDTDPRPALLIEWAASRGSE